MTLEETYADLGRLIGRFVEACGEGPEAMSAAQDAFVEYCDGAPSEYMDEVAHYLKVLVASAGGMPADTRPGCWRRLSRGCSRLVVQTWCKTKLTGRPDLGHPV